MENTINVKKSGEWAVISIRGSLYETMRDVLDILNKGKGSGAKVVEGHDPQGNVHTLVIIEGYKE